MKGGVGVLRGGGWGGRTRRVGVGLRSEISPLQEVEGLVLRTAI